MRSSILVVEGALILKDYQNLAVKKVRENAKEKIEEHRVYLERIEQYWVNAYSEIDTVENKLAVIEKCGYAIVSHFALNDKCWIDKENDTLCFLN